MVDPYEALGNAVVVQAVRDWRDAVETLNRKGLLESDKGSHAAITKQETEIFFNSRYFNIFTTLSGKMILDGLKKEIGI